MSKTETNQMGSDLTAAICPNCNKTYSGNGCFNSYSCVEATRKDLFEVEPWLESRG